MAKINFQKVEEELSRGLSELERKKIFTEYEKGALAHVEVDTIVEKQKSLSRLIHWLYRHDKELYAKLHRSRQEVDELLQKKHEELSSDEKFAILRLVNLTSFLKRKTEERMGFQSDDELVAKERKDHSHKRFKVKDRWLPL